MKLEKADAAELERLRLLTQYEVALYREGVRCIAGIDEAGRGPLAGPVVAAAVILPETFALPGVNDSKKLSAAVREELAHEIKRQAVCWAVGMVFPPHLDEINIYQATKLAMRRAVNALSTRPDHLIIDAVKLPELGIAQTPLIKGDAKSISVASASIIAKVERDFIMNGLEELYPGYGLARHKGYATKDHIQALTNLGPSPIHRRSFEPVKSMLGGEACGDQGRLFD
ncbi:MAG: ribonuclease HII [Candidatus Saccharibacteria bacterium]